MELNREELEELLPLYALDALEPDEHEQVARYVEQDERARTEVESLREIAMLLAHDETRAPVSLWSRIEDSLRSQVASTPFHHEPPVLHPTRPRRRSRRPAQIAAALCVAAALIAVIVLGIQVVHQQRRIDNLATAMHTDTMRAAARAAENMPGAHTIALASSDGTHTGHIVMMPDGSGYFMDSNLPQLDAADTYQLWAKAGDATARMVSVGLLGQDPRVVPFRLSGTVTGFEVTRESAPGDAEPSSPVMMSGTVS